MVGKLLMIHFVFLGGDYFKMDFLNNYRKTIKDVLNQLTKIPYAHGNIQFETVFDNEKDRYLLMVLGRRGLKRIHGCLVHVDIINGKLWIQHDGTEHGVAYDFIEAGISKDRIVLGYKSEEIRKHTGLAVA